MMSCGLGIQDLPSDAMVPTLFDYRVVCHRDDDTYVAYVPAIEGCHAVGSSPADAQSELKNVFEMILEEFEERGERPPEDRELALADAC